MNQRILLITVCAFIILFGSYIYCHPPKGCEEKIVYIHDTVRIKDGDTAIANKTICLNYDNYQPSTLSIGLIRDMISNYRTNQLNAITNNATGLYKPTPTSNYEDAHSVWFDLDTLKKFIYHVEHHSRQNGATAKLGLRIYYAAYPNNTLWGNAGYEGLAVLRNTPTTLNYQRLHTVVIIPTLDIGGGATDFNPLDTKTYTHGLNGLIGWRDSSTNLRLSTLPALTAVTNTTNDVAARNHGDLTPPGTTVVEGF